MSDTRPRSLNPSVIFSIPKAERDQEVIETRLQVFEAEAMQHVKELYRTALRLTRDPAEADDLAQETYMQAWKSFDRYKQGTNCRAWLYKILFNKFDHYRRKKYTQAKYFQEADELVFINSVYKPSVPAHLTDTEVIAGLNRLSGYYRSVILLADLHQFNYKEVAEILNIPIGTVMSRLSRARTHLRKSLVRTAVEFGIKVSTGSDRGVSG